MRSELEIREVYDRLGQEPERDTHKTPLFDWSADTFKFGFLVGKLTALGWVLGDERGAEVASDYDYEDWRRTQKEAGDDLKEFLRGLMPPGWEPGEGPPEKA
jgi:hypothetical protein